MSDLEKINVLTDEKLEGVDTSQYPNQMFATTDQVSGSGTAMLQKINVLTESKLADLDTTQYPNQIFGTKDDTTSGGSPKFAELVDGTIASVDANDLSDVSTIRANCFIGITTLESVEIPSNVQTIGDSAFEGCTSLSTLSIADGVQTIGDSAFEGINAEIDIPSSVTSVGESAFANNTAISEVTIPSGITELPSKLFDGCTKLSKVTMDSAIPPTIESDTFPSNVVEIYVKYGAYDDYYSAWSLNLFNNKMEIGDIGYDTGNDTTSSVRVRVVGYIAVEPNTTYVFTRSSSTGAIGIRTYNSSKSFLGGFSPMSGGISSAEFTTDSNTHYIRFIQETTDTNVKYEIYAKEGGVNQKLVRLPAIPSTLTITVNNYLGELVNGAEVTISGNGQTYTGTTNENGIFTQADLQPATYSIEVADLEGFKTPNLLNVIVDENVNATATITYLEKDKFSSVFSENSPDIIAEVSKQIAENNMTSSQVTATYGWKLGDTISYNLTTGEKITMRIIGFNHDTLSDGSGKAGITLDMTHCLSTQYPMNSTATNAGGWTASNVYKSVLPTIEATIPREWQKVIKMVDKKAWAGSGNVATNSVGLFLLSFIEVSGNNNYAQYGNSLSQEGSLYEYYPFGYENSWQRQKSSTSWWLRSTMYGNSFEIVDENGSLKYSSNANIERGLSYAFCV